MNDGSFDDIICQTAIQTEADKSRYLADGYYLAHTVAEITDKLPGIDVNCLHYSKSMSLGCFYYNPETLAVCNTHLELLSTDPNAFCTAEKLQNMIAFAEKQAVEKNFMPFQLVLPDRMKLEYYGKVFQKFGAISGLYQQFMDIYQVSDYGFNGIDIETVNGIISYKTEEEHQATAEMLKDFPEVLTIYRGGNSASADYRKAYSWTLDINVANFFACRRGSDDGYIAVATINKSDVIEYFGDARSEEEVLVHPEKLTITTVIPIYGMLLLEEVIPKVNSIYQEYRYMLSRLKFTRDSEEHGKLHSLRVLMLTQIIAEQLELPRSERLILAEAAVFHDTRRRHDGVDTEHGLAASHYAAQCGANAYVKFLCKYHCLPDKKGYAEIERNDKLRKSREVATRLLNIFKDADALDRVRFSIRDLDVHQLRLPVSKELTLAARLCFENLKL